MSQIPPDVTELCDIFTELGLDSKQIQLFKDHLSPNCDKQSHWVGVAIQLRSEKKYHACLATYEAALARFPESHQLWGNLGILYREWERYDEAMYASQRALNIKPDYIFALENMGNILERFEQYSEAIELYSQIVKIDSKRSECWNGLGVCLWRTGQLERVAECFEKSYQLEPKSPKPLFNLAGFYYEQKRYDEALSVINRHLAAWSDDALARKLQKEIEARPTNPMKLSAQPIHDKQLITRISMLDDQNRYYASDLSNTINIEMPPTCKFSDIANMTREQAAATVGLRAWYISKLSELLSEALSRDLLKKPGLGPCLFISYRWESEANKQWIAHFANDLVLRGYEVVYDKLASMEDNPPSVPELISRIAKCDIFVPVLTEGYRRRVEILPGDTAKLIEDGWVFDEWNSAMWLASMNRIRMLGVWRSGPAIPLPLTKNIVVDFRDDNSYNAKMDATFPSRRKHN